MNLIKFQEKLKDVAFSQKETCDTIKSYCSPTDPNYRLEYGRLLGYCVALKELQNDLGIEEDLPVEIDYNFKDLLS